MRIALLDGTGDISEGLALRWAYCTDHEVIVGSRDPDRTRAKADEYETELLSHDRNVKVNGFTNEMAADRASVVILIVPPYHVSDTVEVVSDSLSKGDMFITSAAGMKRDDDGFHYHPPKAGSATASVADAAPDGVPVVGAFHNLAVGRLADLDVDLGIDMLFIADDEDTKETVRLLAEGIDGPRAFDGDGLVNAPEIEGITPLLINVARDNGGLHDLGIRFK